MRIKGRDTSPAQIKRSQSELLNLNRPGNFLSMLLFRNAEIKNAVLILRRYFTGINRVIEIKCPGKLAFFKFLSKPSFALISFPVFLRMFCGDGQRISLKI